MADGGIKYNCKRVIADTLGINFADLMIELIL
jgi:hypothetical protein